MVGFIQMDVSKLTIVIVVVALVVASAISRVLLHNKKSVERENVWRRILTWWGIAGLLLCSLFIGSIAVRVLFGVVSLLSVYELLHLVEEPKQALHTWRFGLILIILANIVVLQLHAGTAALYLLFVTFSWIGLVIVSNNLAVKWFGISFITSSLSLVAVMGSYEALFFLLFITSVNDIAQYICGKIWGKHKLAPRVSPQKTWEGFIGGVAVSSSVGAALSHPLLHTDISTAFLVGAILGVAGTVGDLTISLLKRRAKVASTGNVLPGHGGILDRVDSLLVTTPVFYCLIHMFLPRYF